jgi:hypothetical protein
MQIIWREGQRAYYVNNGRVYNSFIKDMTYDGLFWLTDGRVRNKDEIFKSKEMALNWMNEDRE